MSRHTAPMTDDYIAGLRRRNELRMNHSRLALGERWLLHPANAVRCTGSGDHAISLAEWRALMRASHGKAEGGAR